MEWTRQLSAFFLIAIHQKSNIIFAMVQLIDTDTTTNTDTKWMIFEDDIKKDKSANAKFIKNWVG